MVEPTAGGCGPLADQGYLSPIVKTTTAWCRCQKGKHRKCSKKDPSNNAAVASWIRAITVNYKKLNNAIPPGGRAWKPQGSRDISGKPGKQKREQ